MDKAYTDQNMWLEIPSLGVKQPIVGVPGPKWDVTWLGSNIGYLQGTAFPTWNGNSVLTGHATNANGKPGPMSAIAAMLRIKSIAIALCCAVAACSPAPDASTAGPTVKTAGQDAAQREITTEKIAHDVVGRVVKITEVNGEGIPTDWTFEASEFKKVEILEREATPTDATITVFLTTRNNPGANEDAVQVSGKLRLHYQRKGAGWSLTGIENLTFRYTIGVST